ncbi:MAG: HAD-IIB family hydrolase [Actinobacteria bacterium]|nr:HAD-IIB family hydrolase [Actinomycetota bacterium]
MTSAPTRVPGPEDPALAAFPDATGIRLIASDLDGTLLDSLSAVSARTARAITDATGQGLLVVAATGRQVTQVPSALAACGVRYIVGSNGAIASDVAEGRILFEELLDPAAAAGIVAYLTAELEGVRFSAVRDHGTHHAAEPGYLDLLTARERELWWADLDTQDLASVVSEPTLKLTVRHPVLTADELLVVAERSGLSGFTATTSGAPFLEIQGAGITKATGVARLCALLEVDAAQVLAAGDANNDVALLAWAGLGVAMGNAVDAALAVADWVTGRNDEDGLAVAIERTLAQVRTA